MNDKQKRLLWREATIVLVVCPPLLLDAYGVVTLSTSLKVLLFALLAVAIGMRFWQRAQRRDSI